MFGEILRDYPDDGPTRAFIQRCWEYHQQPPEGNWDGVYVMMEK
jgi:adenylate cyclase